MTLALRPLKFFSSFFHAMLLLMDKSCWLARAQHGVQPTRPAAEVERYF